MEKIGLWSLPRFGLWYLTPLSTIANRGGDSNSNSSFHELSELKQQYIVLPDIK